MLGAAPSGTAAERLADDTGLASTTPHRLLLAAEPAGGLPRGCALVLDEAAMAETRLLARTLALVEEAGGKAILVGDPPPAPRGRAGGLFAALVEREGALSLSGNRRQRDPEAREALAALRRGEGRDYLAYAERCGRLLVDDDASALRARLLRDWWQAARGDLAGSVMLAHRRVDVAELNAAARALMDAEGRLGRERLEVGGREFALGDRVVCLRNADRLGVRNGTRGTVVALEGTRRDLRVRTDRGDEVILPRHYLDAGHVRHAYALTGHASQGLTVERSFVLARAGGRLREWGYVALSRAREETRLYLLVDEGEPDRHAREIDGRDPLSCFAEALESSAEERLALDQHGPAAPPRGRTRPVLERSSGELLRERRRLATEKLKAESERRLAAAERALACLPHFRQGRRREGLRAEIARQRASLRLADATLERLEGERTAQPEALPARVGRELVQERTPRPRREREDVQLELGL